MRSQIRLLFRLQVTVLGEVSREHLTFAIRLVSRIFRHCSENKNWISGHAPVQERALRILQGKARDVAAGMRRSATLQNLSANARENVDKCATFLLNYRPYLQYNLYLEQGYPIASGVIEGACRHLNQ
jgi:hypothetical protein